MGGVGRIPSPGRTVEDWRMRFCAGEAMAAYEKEDV